MPRKPKDPVDPARGPRSPRVMSDTRRNDLLAIRRPLRSAVAERKKADAAEAERLQKRAEHLKKNVIKVSGGRHEGSASANAEAELATIEAKLKKLGAGGAVERPKRYDAGMGRKVTIPEESREERDAQDEEDPMDRADRLTRERLARAAGPKSSLGDEPRDEGIKATQPPRDPDRDNRRAGGQGANVKREQGPVQTGERGGQYRVGPSGTRIYVTDNPGLNIELHSVPAGALPPPVQATPFAIRGDVDDAMRQVDALADMVLKRQQQNPQHAGVRKTPPK